MKTKNPTASMAFAKLHEGKLLKIKNNSEKSILVRIQTWYILNAKQ
jgi:hypothetical protein